MKKTLIKKSPIISLKVIYLICTVFMLIVLSCSKNEDGIINESISEANLVTSSGIENAPDQSGAFLFRYPYEGGIALTLVDAKSELVATIGYPDLLPTFCGGDFPDDILTFQDIISASNGERIISLGQGDLKVHVFGGTLNDINDFSTWCPFLSSAPLLAEGYGKAVAPTNDLSISETNNTANMILTINGELLSPSNEIKRFTARVLFSFDKEEEFNSLLDILVSVTIQLR